MKGGTRVFCCGLVESIQSNETGIKLTLLSTNKQTKRTGATVLAEQGESCCLVHGRCALCSHLGDRLQVRASI